MTLSDLTVANVSGMIAAAVTVVQIIISLAIPLILLGLLQERNSATTASAVTWYVATVYYPLSTVLADCR